MPTFYYRGRCGSAGRARSLPGRTAVEGQQTPRPIPCGRRDNLDTPITDLHRIRGSFMAIRVLARAAPLMVGELGPCAAIVAAVGVGRGLRLGAQCRSLQSSPRAALVPDPISRAAGDRLDGERGIDAADGGNTDPSQIHRLGISQLRQSAFTTLLRGCRPCGPCRSGDRCHRSHPRYRSRPPPRAPGA